jgi:hypothetical protein
LWETNGYGDEMNYTPPVIDESRYPKSRTKIIDIPIDLSRVIKSELVDELSKREGVKLYGPYDEVTHYKLEGKGSATILVIKK